MDRSVVDSLTKEIGKYNELNAPCLKKSKNVPIGFGIVLCSPLSNFDKISKLHRSIKSKQSLLWSTSDLTSNVAKKLAFKEEHNMSSNSEAMKKEDTVKQRS